MKAKDIIDNYCRLFKVDIPEIRLTETNYFVTLSPKGASVLYMREPSLLLGRIVGGAMRYGMVLHVRNGWVKLLLWEDWKRIWNEIFVPKTRKTPPIPNYSRPYKSQMFKTMQQPPAHKKPQKHGFECTYTANKSLDVLGLPFPIGRSKSLNTLDNE